MPTQPDYKKFMIQWQAKARQAETLASVWEMAAKMLSHLDVCESDKATCCFCKEARSAYLDAMIFARKYHNA